MSITDDQVAVLRSMLAADFDTHRRLTGELDRASAWDGYPALVAAAFFEAVHRRFGKSYTRGEVVQFVATARIRFDHADSKPDALVSERLIVAALEDEALENIDEKVIARTQFVLLAAFIVDEGLDAAGLDSFMESARELGDEWIAREDE